MQEEKYLLTADSHVFNLTETESARLDAVAIGKNRYHILDKGVSYHVEVTKADFQSKKYTVVVNHTPYEVSIENGLDLLIKEMGFTVGTAKQVNAIKAPMPGLILEISVVVGQEVQENDPLLILEAMKMENSFVSPRSGTIKSISVSKGNAVDKGQLLIEFE